MIVNTITRLQWVQMYGEYIFVVNVLRVVQNVRVMFTSRHGFNSKLMKTNECRSLDCNKKYKKNPLYCLTFFSV